MPIFRKADTSVSALAAELEASRQATEAAIADARAYHEANRASVIERGTAAAANARRLEAEARAEAEAAEDLVAKA